MKTQSIKSKGDIQVNMPHDALIYSQFIRFKRYKCGTASLMLYYLSNYTSRHKHTPPADENMLFKCILPSKLVASHLAKYLI